MHGVIKVGTSIGTFSTAWNSTLVHSDSVAKVYTHPNKYMGNWACMSGPSVSLLYLGTQSSKHQCLWGKKKKKKTPMSVPRCKKRPHGNFRKPRSRLLMVVEISTTLTIYTHAPLTRSRLMNSSTRADYSKLFTGQVSHPAKPTKPPHHKVSIRREQKSTIRTVESPRYIS